MRAFPHSFERVPNHPGFAESEGMDLRDYFAAKAMAALLNAWEINGVSESDIGIAERVYEIADAMMKAREV